MGNLINLLFNLLRLGLLSAIHLQGISELQWENMNWHRLFPTRQNITRLLITFFTSRIKHIFGDFTEDWLT